MVNPVDIFIKIVYPQLAVKVRDVVRSLMDMKKEAGEEVAVEDGFQLYQELSEIRRIYLESVPRGVFPVHLEDLFLDFPKRYLQTVDSNIIGWVEAAIQQDKMLMQYDGQELGETNRHTSSVVDVFRSFNAAIAEIRKLDWQDDLHFAKFMTIISKIFGRGIMRYCEELEIFFTHEMSKKTPEQIAAQSQTKQQKWMAMAKDAWSNKEKVEPFQFAPEVCMNPPNIPTAPKAYVVPSHV